MPRRCGERFSLRGDETGAFLILWAVLLIGLMTMVAILVDLSGLRSNRRADQNVADVAALAAGKNLGAGNPVGACEDAIRSFNANAPSLSSTIDPVVFCTQQPNNNVGSTTCSAGGTFPEAEPKTTVGRYKVELHYPVPAGEISDSVYGSGLNDGTACQRLRVLVTTTDHTFFGGVVGASTLSTTRTATVKPAPSKANIIPALWLLDPFGCVSLNVSGNSEITIGQSSPSVIPGVISIDSDSSACTGQQETVSSSGSASNSTCTVGTCVQAIPVSGANAGSINLFALPGGATSCSGYACSQDDVTNLRVQPQPVSASQRATRAPVDWVYNCKTGYPLFHTITINDCPYAGTTAPYLDNLNGLKNLDGTSSLNTKNKRPDNTYSQWTKSPSGCSGSACYSCTAATGVTIVPAGNYWIDCSSFSLGNGATVEFTGGNVVLDGDLKMSSGSELDMNTARTDGVPPCTLPRPTPPPDSQDPTDPCTPSNPASNLPASCISSPTARCLLDNSSDLAALLYMRGGAISMTGGALHLNHVSVYQFAGDGNDLSDNSAVPPVWIGPLEGQLAGLAYWSESVGNNTSYSLAGGANVAFGGTFFVPEAAPLKLTGSGNWGQQNAQFIAFQLEVSGGSIIHMTPNANYAVKPPAPAGVLIR